MDCTNSNYDYLVIFSLAFYPAYNPKPKDLPIGILNEIKVQRFKIKMLTLVKN